MKIIDMSTVCNQIETITFELLTLDYDNHELIHQKILELQIITDIYVKYIYNRFNAK